MLRRLVLPALLLVPLAVAPLPATAAAGEGVGPARHSFRAAPLPVSDVLPALDVLAADTCADGNLVHDEVGGAAGVALPNLQVQLWDRDSTSADDLLATGLTGVAGAFLLCSATEDLDDTANDGLDLYVRAVTENGFWRVQDSEAYQFSLALAANVAAGTTHHYGQSRPGDGTPQAGALQIYNALDRFWSWTAAQHANDCWDALDHKPPSNYAGCRQLVVQWRADTTSQPFYDSALNRVHLGATDFKWRDAVVREAAKAVMDDLFEDGFPDTQNCGPRTQIKLQTTRNCAWVNGFADWVAVQVFADPVLDWQVGAQVFHENLETPGWDTPGWEQGDAVEGRVAGALLDLADAANEAPWDRVAQGPNPLWVKLLNGSFDQLAELAYVGDNALATLYQNTIDYGLRDPLVNAAVLTRRTPSPPQNFRYTTTSQRWSVMAIRPPQGFDYDLRLFGTADLAGAPLSTSTAGGSAVDLVAIDSNPGRRALGTFYPQVYQYAGAGDYVLKFVQAGSSIAVGQSTSVLMSASNPVVIWETTVAAGAVVKLEVTQPAGLDAELMLFCATAGSNTWVRGRPSASAIAPQLASGTETLTWTAPATAPGPCAVVLANKSGSGTYTVTRKP